MKYKIRILLPFGIECVGYRELTIAEVASLRLKLEAVNKLGIINITVVEV